MLHERRQTATGDVARVIREVRAGWRRRLLVRGPRCRRARFVLIGAGAALEAAPSHRRRDRWRHRLVDRAPLLTQVSDEQVALYLEDTNPR
jgi:hypothetical protein